LTLRNSSWRTASRIASSVMHRPGGEATFPFRIYVLREGRCAIGSGLHPGTSQRRAPVAGRSPMAPEVLSFACETSGGMRASNGVKPRCKSSQQEIRMRTPAHIARHPIHPMLVPLPIGMWVLSLACDIIAAFSANPATWKIVALYAMVGGIIGALAAAIFGLIDLLSLPHDIRSTAITHMVINLTVVVLFVIDAWLRIASPDAGVGAAAPVWLSVIALVLLVVSGWLGGKMVYRFGVAVDTETICAEPRTARRT
jgi:uncharacterized membrane protein